MQALPDLTRSDLFLPPPSSWRQRVHAQVEKWSPQSNIEDTIVLSGTGRSGTTWMGEIFRTLNRYKYLNEPFAHSPFRIRTYVDSHSEVPNSVRKYINESFKGKVGRSWRWRFASSSLLGQFADLIKNDRVIAKLTRGLRMSRWISNTFDIRQMYVIIRHPCAVVSSMLQHGGWRESRMKNRGEDTYERIVGRNLPQNIVEKFESYINKVDSKLEMLAHIWALDYYVALLHEEHLYPWVLIPYERIVMYPEKELERMMSAIGEGVTEPMKKKCECGICISF